METKPETEQSVQQSSNVSLPTNQREALQILINAVSVAQKRGAFSLKEAALLSNCVDFFIVVDPASRENVTNSSSTTDKKKELKIDGLPVSNEDSDDSSDSDDDIIRSI